MAVDWGGLIGGAIGGGIGMFGGPAMAGLGATAGYGIGSQFGGGGDSRAAEPGGWSWLQAPQYSFTEPRYRLASDVMMQEMERMQRGEMPAWYSGIAPTLRKEMKESMLPQVQAYDVARGRGRGAEAGTRYTEQVRAIDEYIAKLGYGAQRETMGMLPQFAQGVPSGPTGQFAAYGPSPYQPTGMEQMGQMFGQVAPWLMGGMGGGQQQWGGQIPTAGGQMQQPLYGGQPAMMQDWMRSMTMPATTTPF